MRRLAALLACLTVALFAVGCGGSNDQTAAAAKCLHNALLNQAFSSGDVCGGLGGAAKLADGAGTRISVGCTHKEGDEYVCDVTGPGTQSVLDGGTGLVTGGFYAVTYDGKSIVFRQGS